ncbi:DUF6207 family protein [Streptomyces sp. 24-1644]|uniref:DUF6207 family protein n=1 Tax=Streptomyces sp. 24-1644 TaxID=3457315 RepID=UPI003FA74E5B
MRNHWAGDKQRRPPHPLRTDLSSYGWRARSTSRRGDGGARSGMKIDTQHIRESGLAVLGITGGDETTACPVTAELELWWATSGIARTAARRAVQHTRPRPVRRLWPCKVTRPASPAAPPEPAASTPGLTSVRTRIPRRKPMPHLRRPGATAASAVIAAVPLMSACNLEADHAQTLPRPP